MPNYEESSPKRSARAEVADTYLRLSGNTKLPPERSFWSLCLSGTEISQLTESGFLQLEQYQGINRSRLVIDPLRAKFPRASLTLGEWSNVIQGLGSTPGCIYFDSIQELENPKLHEDIACTMRLCPPSTLLTVNTLVNNPIPGRIRLLRDTKLATFLGKRFDDQYLRTWNLELPAYEYRTNRAQMRTYLFWKIK
jgi:hypothetical protein